MTFDDSEATSPELTPEERHRRVYDGGRVPAFTYRAIGAEKRLWHGRNPLTALDVGLLAGEGITHVLDLREESEWVGPGRVGVEAIDAMAERGIVRSHVPIRDVSAAGADQFDRAVAFLDSAWTDPAARLYVHCRLGRERTGTILAAWWALRNDTTCDQAVDALCAAGARIDPLPDQRRAAQGWVNTRRRDGTP